VKLVSNYIVFKKQKKFTFITQLQHCCTVTGNKINIKIKEWYCYHAMHYSAQRGHVIA